MADRDDPDADLFSAEMADVTPLAKGRERERSAGGLGAPSTGEQARRDAALGLTRESVDPNYLTLGDVPAREPLEYLEWKKVGVQRGVFARLRKGDYPLEADLDLHRKTVKEARKLVFQFLARASARGWRTLRIASGKGELSPTPARLKSYLAAWLEAHTEVIAFCSAQKRHGGVGAVYVMIRKSKEASELNREAHGQKSES